MDNLEKGNNLLCHFVQHMICREPDFLSLTSLRRNLRWSVHVVQETAEAVWAKNETIPSKSRLVEKNSTLSVSVRILFLSFQARDAFPFRLTLFWEYSTAHASPKRKQVLSFS